MINQLKYVYNYREGRNQKWIRHIAYCFMSAFVFICCIACNQIRANEINLNKRVIVTRDNFEEVNTQIMANSPKITSLQMSFALTQEELKKLYESTQNNIELGHISWNEHQFFSFTEKQLLEKKLIDNNKNYRDYPNDYVFGLLSKHAYKDSKEKDPIDLPGILDQPLENWYVEKVYDDNDNSGYYGVIYRNDQTHQIVLANRGTDEQTISDLVSTLDKKNSDWKTNFEAILAGKIMGGQLARNFQATAESIEMAQNLTYRLSFTGHSLGAWLAEMSVYYCHAYFEYFTTKGVTFDSPGSLPLMERLQPTIKNLNTVKLKNLDIVTYLASPNPANVCNPHVGTVYRIYPEMPSPDDYIPSFLPKFMQNALSKVIDYFQASDTIEGILAFTGHDLARILHTFDPQTGKPKNSTYIKSWPRIEYKGEAFADKDIKLIKATIKQYIEPSFLGLGLFQDMISKKIINWSVNGLIEYLVGDKVIMTLVGFIKSYINNDISQKQYWLYYKYKEFKNNSDEIRIKLNYDQRFELVAKANYDEGTEEYILTPIAGSLDHFLYELDEKREIYIRNKDQAYLPQLVEIQLQELLSNYNIERFDDQKIKLSTISNNCDFRYVLQKASRLQKVIPKAELNRDPDESDNSESAPIVCSKLLANLPRDEDYYTQISGKETEIENKLNTFGKAVISGAGGMGKSTLAAKYGMKKKQQGWQVRWVKATQIDEEFFLLARDLGLQKISVLRPQSIRNKIYKNFENCPEKVLLIFDNVENEEKIREYLENLPSHVKVLLTAKNKFLLNRNYHVELKGFSKQEAEEYLKEALKERNIKENVLQKLQTTIGESPFRLSKSVAYLKSHELITINEFIKEYESIKKGHSHNGDIYPAVDMLFKDLKVKSAAEWQLLKYLAYLDAEGVTVTNDKGAREQFIMDIVGQSFLTFDELKRLSLIDVITENNKTILKVNHRLVQTETRKALIEEDKNQPSQILEKLVKILLHFFKDYSRITPELLRQAKTILEAIDDANLSVAGQEILLLYELGMYYDKIEDYKSAIYYYEQLSNAKYNNNGYYTIPKVSVLQNIAYWYRRLGGKVNNQKALEFAEKAFNLLQDPDFKRDNDYDLVVARSIYNIGAYAANSGNIEKGLYAKEEALKRYLALFSGNNHSIADTLWHIGSGYQDLGDNDKALEYFKQAFSIASSLWKKDPSGTSLLPTNSEAIIENLSPNFFKKQGMRKPLNEYYRFGANKVGFEWRFIITSRGVVNENIIKVKQKLQKNILNKIVQAVDDYGWTYESFFQGDWGVKSYINEDKLQKELGELNNKQNLIIARMLCFESMNIGIMKSEKKPYQVVKSFVQKDPKLVKKIAKEHPEFFVDGSIAKACVEAMIDDYSFVKHIFDHVKYMGMDKILMKKSQL